MRQRAPNPAQRVCDAAMEEDATDVPPQPQGSVKRRWNQAIDDTQLLHLTDPGRKIPKSSQEWRHLAMQMWDGCEVAQVKAACKKLNRGPSSFSRNVCVKALVTGMMRGAATASASGPTVVLMPLRVPMLLQPPTSPSTPIQQVTPALYFHQCDLQFSLVK